MKLKKVNKIWLVLFLFFLLFNFKITQAGWWSPGQGGQQYLEQIGKEGFGISGPPGGGVLQRTVFTIINYLLGFLGIVFIALIIYGGLVWMTSLGNDQKIEQARKILGNAAIGLAIVLASYAVTLFVFNVLIRATGG